MNAFDPYRIAEVSIQALMISLLLAAFCAAIIFVHHSPYKPAGP